MGDGVVQLHNHFHTSRLDGHQRPEEGLDAAAAAGQTALAMTDHGNCNGHYDFHRQAKKRDIAPILGCEIYVAPSGPDGEPSDRFGRSPVRWERVRGKDDDEQAEGKGVSGAGKYTHQTILAQNAEGLRNLWALTAKASRDGFYGNPRADHALLREHAAGLIATTGCPSGELQTRLRLGQHAQAQAVVERDLEIFGRDHFFVEVMDHGIDIEKQVRADLLDIMHRYGLRPLATNDSHYARQEDAAAHDALLAIQSGKNLDDPKRWRFDGDSYYIRSAAEMRALFDDEIPGACDNTLLVAEMVGLDAYADVFAPKNRMPRFKKIPAGLTAEEYLRQLTYDGLHQRYGAALPAEVVERAEYELDLIIREGFVHYFLVLWDMCAFMRRSGILFGPRGSAAGSIVIYSLFIAAVDPLRFGLMFERFINPDRVGPPDVDVDIDDHRRAEVLQYMIEQYGANSTAAIITFGILGGKASIKDSARILGEPVSVGELASKAYPPALFGKGVFLKDVFDEQHPRYEAGAPLRELVALDKTVRKVVETAKKVERRLRAWGQHACGFVASDEELIGHIPLDYDHKTGMVRIGFEYPDAEEMGFQKLDALGLRNLRILADALEWIEKLHGVEIDLDDESFDDPAVYELLRSGHTLSIFQLEGGGMQKLLRMIEPDKFEDIMAVGALYRPGPMGEGSHEKYALRKTGRQRVEPIHPELDGPLRDVLAETYGVICYQEQVMQAVREVAGFTPGAADELRKAMGKKKQEVLDGKRAEFDAGARAKGFSAEAADTLWRTLEPFASYAFNRAHTACYGRIAYWTAYLKAHYPAEYMAAVLDAEAGNKDKLGIYLAECRRMGLKVLVPDINESTAAFTPTADGAIRFGLAGIRDVGKGVVEAVISGRRQRPYRDFIDFLERTGRAACTKKAVQGLIEGGAFDSIEPNRAVLFDAAEKGALAAARAKKIAETGQVDFFTAAAPVEYDEDGEVIERIVMTGVSINRTLAPFERVYQLERERERLGLYLSGHPLDGKEATLAAHRTETTAELIANDPVLVGDGIIDRDFRLSGSITAVEVKSRKKDGAPFAVVTLEDLDGVVEVLFFTKAYAAVKDELVIGRLVSLAGATWGKISGGGDEPEADDGTTDELAPPKVEVTYTGRFVDEIQVIDPDAPLAIRLYHDRIDQAFVDELKAICDRHPGEQRITFHVVLADKSVENWRPPNLRVQMSAAFVSEMKELAGRNCFIRRRHGLARAAA